MCRISATYSQNNQTSVVVEHGGTPKTGNWFSYSRSSWTVSPGQKITKFFGTGSGAASDSWNWASSAVCSLTFETLDSKLMSFKAQGCVSVTTVTLTFTQLLYYYGAICAGQICGLGVVYEL